MIFLISPDYFGCACSALWVWCRYGWWCVGNLEAYPFQTEHGWIYISRLLRGWGIVSKQCFGKIPYFENLNFQNSSFLSFSISTDLFGCGCSALGVWYRYGRWCVGNLGPYPFQTWHDWICTPRLPCWKGQFFFNRLRLRGRRAPD